MNNFKKDLNFSEKMQTSVDEHLIECIKDLDGIERLKDEENKVHILDQFFAIDGIIKTNSGILITFQEKIRRNDYRKYQDFTLEYFSNSEKCIKGEFFHLCAEYYITGYSNKEENGLVEFRILSILNLKKYIRNNFEKLLNSVKSNVKHSKANFFISFLFKKFKYQ